MTPRAAFDEIAADHGFTPAYESVETDWLWVGRDGKLIGLTPNTTRLDWLRDDARRLFASECALKASDST